ncbi:MAG: ASKHA domain-containing protein [Candidatus Bathyarchaeia archaeon]
MSPDLEKFAVTFQPMGRRVAVREGASILEAAQAAGVVIWSVCGGKGTCGKCKILLKKSEATERGVTHKFLSERELELGYRLACQTHVEDDMEVIVPPESRLIGEQILSRSNLALEKLNPAILKLALHVQAIGGSEPQVESRILQEAATKLCLPDLCLGEDLRDCLRSLLSAGGGEVTFTINVSGACPGVLGVELGDTTARSFGLAVDLGTTTIVAYMVDINTGGVLASAASYNGQIAYGEDLLSRVNFAARSIRNREVLKKAAVETLNSLISNLAAKSGVKSEEVVDVCLAGNTIMVYLLAGQNPAPLLDADAKVSLDPLILNAQSLGLKVSPRTNVFCLPSVSRYVGGDVIGDILASGLFNAPEISVLIDMGTNGEVVVGSKGWGFCSSCASGPAFEGWEIKFGMRAVAGAIDHLKIDRESLKARYTVIGGGEVKPLGICGSGLIDAVAEMFLSGILNHLGRFRPRKSNFVRMGAEGPEYLIAPASETAHGRDIVITQRDVENLLQSKAAVCAAVSILLNKLRITIEDVRHLYLAGAFGNYVDPRSAVAAGVFPEFPRAEVVQLGNGAIAGAYLTLLSVDKRREAAEIAKMMTYFDLSADPDFMEEFNAALTLPGKPELFPSMHQSNVNSQT